ncbi:MAG: aminodeoxychorismate synthase component I [bacterium]|nr:aminodeoxychorismate synthase component I [bacterium]
MLTKKIDIKSLTKDDSILSISDHLFSILSELPQPFILESPASEDHKSGKFTFMGADPFLTIEATDKNITINEGSQREELAGDPLTAFNDMLTRFREKTHPEYPFSSGAVGYIAYEAGEPIPARKKDELSLPDLRFGFYDTVLLYDHQKKQLTIVSTGQPEKGVKKKKRAKERLDQFTELVSKNPGPKEDEPKIGVLKSNFSRDDYIKGVERIKEYITEGDIYQANLSQRFKAPFSGSPYLLYKRFRDLNPVSFGGYLGYDDLSIICNSPERFLSLRGSKLESRPIKGTIKREKGAIENYLQIRALKSSKKETAEHIMIVDMVRNDLGRVCRYGTVKVDELMKVESYSNLHHTVSTVSGEPGKGLTPVDCIRAAFPGGSITGAPKIRAMEIIHEIEPNPRWIYTGSIGYIGFDGNMDLNIAIRTAFVKDGSIYFSAGGGIVADSDPAAEYDETLLKGDIFKEIAESNKE